MKRCSKCKEEKEPSEFVKNISAKDGLTSACKKCRAESQRQNWKEDPERHRAYGRKYSSANRPKIRARKKAYEERCGGYWTLWRSEWKKENPEKAKVYLEKSKPSMRATKALRRAAEKNSVPKWLTDEQRAEIKAVYKSAATMSEFHEMEFHVDHIEPLRGKTNCGLHVPWNLQILTKEENLRKSNKL